MKQIYLQLIYIPRFSASELERINSKIELSKNQLAVETKTNQLKKMNSFNNNLDSVSIKQQMEQLSQSIRETQDKIEQKKKQLGELLLHLAQLQSAAVVLGDCDMNIVRKERHQKKQNQILDFLLEQHARQLLLIKYLDNEMHDQAQTEALLIAIENQLKELATTHDSRLVRRIHPFSFLISFFFSNFWLLWIR